MSLIIINRVNRKHNVVTILTTAYTLKVKLTYNLNVIVLVFLSTDFFITYLDFGPAGLDLSRRLLQIKLNIEDYTLIQSG